MNIYLQYYTGTFVRALVLFQFTRTTHPCVSTTLYRQVPVELYLPEAKHPQCQHTRTVRRPDPLQSLRTLRGEQRKAGERRAVAGMRFLARGAEPQEGLGVKVCGGGGELELKVLEHLPN